MDWKKLLNPDDYYWELEGTSDLDIWHIQDCPRGGVFRYGKDRVLFYSMDSNSSKDERVVFVELSPADYAALARIADEEGPEKRPFLEPLSVLLHGREVILALINERCHVVDWKAMRVMGKVYDDAKAVFPLPFD
jgi:hypothetical protein